jgi:endonuclease/exonuclease/phosphatase family metal-dependent hydrolase
MPQLRIATFNLENFDDTAPDDRPTLAERIMLMRPQIRRLAADIVCFQEVNGQERDNQPRRLLALQQLLDDTNLTAATLVSTETSEGQVYDERNLVVAAAPGFAVLGHDQIKNDLVDPPLYKRLTASPADTDAIAVEVERPILHVRVDVAGAALHVINVHLKSKIATTIPGQKIDNFTWRSADSWAEGSFLSSLKRMSQALEVRRLVDQILDADPGARIVVAGDFNAEPDEVAVLAIRGDVEDTGNGDLAPRVLVPIENTIAAPARYTLFHHGRGQMLDHMLVTRNLLAGYHGSEIHNELLHDESVGFATDRKFPESDHAPVVATFTIH